jgi:hypothetical protein
MICVVVPTCAEADLAPSDIAAAEDSDNHNDPRTARTRVRVTDEGIMKLECAA